MAFEQATDWLAVDLPRGAAPVHWDELGDVTAMAPAVGPAHARGETLELRVELGRTHLDARQAAELRKGSVVPLDTAAGTLVDLYAGDRPIGRGEPLVLDGRLAFRVAELFGEGEQRECR